MLWCVCHLRLSMLRRCSNRRSDITAFRKTQDKQQCSRQHNFCPGVVFIAIASLFSFSLSHVPLPNLLSRNHFKFRFDALVFFVPWSGLLESSGGRIFPGLYQRLPVVMVLRPLRRQTPQKISHEGDTTKADDSHDEISWIRQGLHHDVTGRPGRWPATASRKVGVRTAVRVIHPSFPQEVFGELTIVVSSFGRTRQHRMGIGDELEFFSARVLLVEIRMEF
mmetsp:Transcript_14927/g.33689  ORF Transcript_14927/g.33689 Transcript_14927/m.33689 type:complete len:222 (-) Transcript_14927:106-771(-)